MSAEENKAIFLQFIKELGKGNLGIIDEVCSPNFAFHSPNFPGWPRGLEGARKLVAAGPSMFSDHIGPAIRHGATTHQGCLEAGLAGSVGPV